MEVDDIGPILVKRAAEGTQQPEGANPPEAEGTQPPRDRLSDPEQNPAGLLHPSDVE